MTPKNNLLSFKSQSANLLFGAFIVFCHGLIDLYFMCNVGSETCKGAPSPIYTLASMISRNLRFSRLYFSSEKDESALC